MLPRKVGDILVLRSWLLVVWIE